MKIVKLKTNQMVNPIGYFMDTISFSWVVEEAAGNSTKEAQIEVSEREDFQTILFDSGKKEGVNSVDFCPDLITIEGKRYFWRVRVWDNQGDFGISDTAYFETARSFTRGKWIKAPFNQNVHPLFRKRFEIKEQIMEARLYITGLGLYEAYINGKKAGNEYLAPFYNDYNLWIQYQTYDVTELLRTGENAIGVLLGNGWYKGRFGFIDKMDRLYGDTNQLICELHITCKNGTNIVIPSDSSWKCTPSPILDSSIYDGEMYDSRMEIECWAGTACDESIFKETTETIGFSELLYPRLSIPVTIQEKRNPIALIITTAGEQVLDFGQNMTGWVEFLCEEPKDTIISFQFGEILQNGDFYNENLRTAKEEYTYISNGKTCYVRPHFTFYGFRYMKIKGIREIKMENFTGCVIYSQMEQIGEIKTSNAKINQLFSNALWGQKGNFLDVPTDCPQRDERMGWSGDAQVFCATASFNMYTPAFYRKFMYDMKLEQDTLKGSVPHVVPDILGQIERILQEEHKKADNGVVNAPHGSCAWADAATIIPWTLYQFYGNQTLLNEQYHNMKSWVDYIQKIDETKCGGRHLWNYGFHFADWLALDNFHKDTSIGGTDPYYVASVYYYYSAFLTAKAAGVLGNKQDEIHYLKLSEMVKEAIQKEYFTETGRIAVDTQTGMVLALYFELAPLKYKKRLLDDLREKLRQENDHLTTGFVGTPFLCPVLTENGMADIAYTLLLNEDYPSWLYEVNMGATTIWERWDSVLPDGSISDTGMNSLNHYSYGAIIEWMYRYMCGLKPIEQGFRSFCIEPYVDIRFEWVDMKYESVYGTIRSAWRQDIDGVTFQIEVPYDTTAEFISTISGREAYINEERSAHLENHRSIILTKGQYEIKIKY